MSTNWSDYDDCDYANCNARQGEPCTTNAGNVRNEAHANRDMLKHAIDLEADRETYFAYSKVRERLRGEVSVRVSDEATRILEGGLLALVDECAAIAEELAEKRDKKTMQGEEALDALARYRLEQLDA
jgi:histone H3/H4